jgi:mannose-1-phosphate guanylyltransferase/mannose-6-phosphate isomerase
LNNAPIATFRTAVERLKAAGHPEAPQYRRMYRPWGYYESIDQGGRYQVKQHSSQAPGTPLAAEALSPRRALDRWIVVRGAAEVTIDGKVQLAHENESIYLPIGCEHRLANPGKIDLELIEVQTDSYLGEDDIIRIPPPHVMLQERPSERRCLTGWATQHTVVTIHCI